MRTILLLFTLSLFLGGCTAAQRTDEVTYQDLVEQAYARAERAFERKDYVEAARRFGAIRSQFPYSRFAPLSELRLADVYFSQESYPIAVEQYRNFLKLYPNHERIEYARFRIALSFYNQMPKDWFFMPPAYEKDLVRARDAERELTLFLRRHEAGEFAGEARRLHASARRRLADHELYVAEFYLKRKNPRGAAMRLSYLLENYSGVGLDPQALFLLARARIELGEVDRARSAMDDLIEFYPDHELASRARAWVSRHPSQ